MTNTKNTAKWLLIFIGVAALIIGAAEIVNYTQRSKSYCHRQPLIKVTRIFNR